ncbi:serine/threonine protein kinase [Blastopirellula sp. JC732]|uniref:Serine/threonine protein kinase n=1 Tax=Blastopirellula sediminis TaxID=2894196 RepID=A0A9X1MU52_9BACT|nr:serine/threonine-protein kinase [Blastopirellula sediminis]MCC9604564.1 serine/threonine protein kinase [Blastopirellula sediminis]MCC9632137.1 serine/threonine protein kinase [Blastopirellula sediminis]
MRDSEDASRLDSICGQFDCAWGEHSDPPHIDSYLENVEESQRKDLFKSLLTIDVQHRRKRSFHCDHVFYSARYPLYLDTIDLVLSNYDLENASAGPVETTSSFAGPILHDTLPLKGRTGIEAAKSGTNFPRFRKVRPFAKGGMGVVYLAYDEDIGREVLLKQIHGGLNNEAAIKRFVQEGKLTGQLEHPCIVPVYAIGRDENGDVFYAMRRIHGITLSQAIGLFHQKRPLLPIQRDQRFRKLLQSFMRVCEAVEYAHRRGVIHRDIKPLNIITGALGETFLLDWGLAKRMNVSDHPQFPQYTEIEGVVNEPEMTGSGAILGTPAYMSPEQAMGRTDEVGRRSDVYGLGATLYKLLTGEAPFSDENALRMVQKVRAGDFRRPRSVWRGIPRPLEAICLRAMKLEPWLRYTTPLELAMEIEAWLAHEPVPSYRETFLESTLRQLKGVKLLLIAFVSFVLGIFAFIAAITFGAASEMF